MYNEIIRSKLDEYLIIYLLLLVKLKGNHELIIVFYSVCRFAEGVTQTFCKRVLFSAENETLAKLRTMFPKGLPNVCSRA